MHYFGISSNIMSLGGIAIAIGVLVDAGIVMTENVIRHAENYAQEHGEYRSKIGEITLNAARVVGRPIFFSMAIIILAFVPVFALTGMEGKLFHPLAFTKTFAMIGRRLSPLRWCPVLCTFLIRGRLHREEDNPVMRILRGIYAPALRLRIAAPSSDSGIGSRVVWFRVVSGELDWIGIHAAARRANRDVDACD